MTLFEFSMEKGADEQKSIKNGGGI